MTTTHADIVERARLGIEAAFVTRRAVESGDAQIHRLLLTDQTGAQFAVLVPSSAMLPGLKTGASYRFEGLLGAAPVDETVHDALICPDCGGGLRLGQVVDAAGRGIRGSVAQLGLDEPFGIVDAGTTVWRADRDRRQPAQTPQTDPPARPVPDFVCVSCGRHATRAAGAGSVTPRGECE